jgi:AcrR family transcriptional regulator
MKQIARAADIGDATIYKYFPSKEKLLIAYFEMVIADVLKDTASIPELDQYTLHERLQLLVDGVLEAMLGDREFVDITRHLVGKSPLLMMRDGMPGQQLLKQHIAELLDGAEQRGEIAPCDFKGTIAGFFPDYLFAIIVYWLKDDSDEFTNTTQLLELSLAVLVLALKSGIVNKMADLASFLVRSQLARLMQNGSGLLDLLKLARRSMEG